MTRRLPGYDEIAATRAAMHRAKAAHEAVHRLNPLIEAFEERGEWPHGSEDVVAELAARWPEAAVPGGTLLERAKAVRDALVPDARRDHDLEHALEQLLFDQYHGPIQDPAWADVKAILEPLYAERTAMFQPLADAYHGLALRRAGLTAIEQHRAAYQRPEEGPVAAAVAHGTLTALVRSLADSLPAFGIDAAPPAAPEEADLAACDAFVAHWDAWIAARNAEVQALAAEVEAQLARWNEMNRVIESHTG